MTVDPPKETDSYSPGFFEEYTEYILLGTTWCKPIETAIGWIGVSILALLMLITGIVFFPFFVIGIIRKHIDPEARAE